MDFEKELSKLEYMRNEMYNLYDERKQKEEKYQQKMIKKYRIKREKIEQKIKLQQKKMKLVDHFIDRFKLGDTILYETTLKNGEIGRCVYTIVDIDRVVCMTATKKRSDEECEIYESVAELTDKIITRFLTHELIENQKAIEKLKQLTEKNFTDNMMKEIKRMGF